MDTGPHASTASFSILETCLYAEDLAAAERFYGDVLGLTLVSRKAGRHIFFRCGSTMLLLFRPEASRDPSAGAPPHGADGPGHVAFQVPASQLDVWQARLTDNDVEVERVVQWPGGERSIYFRDPAGNSLEFAPASIWE